MTSLCFFITSCARTTECHVFVDLIEAIEEGANCEKIASCEDSGVDESVLKSCLAEKEKQKKQRNK